MKNILIVLGLVVLVGVATFYFTQRITSERILEKFNECGLNAVQFHRDQLWEKRAINTKSESYRFNYVPVENKCVVHTEFSSEIVYESGAVLFNRDSYLYDVSSPMNPIMIDELHGVFSAGDEARERFYSKVSNYGLNFGYGAF